MTSIINLFFVSVFLSVIHTVSAQVDAVIIVQFGNQNVNVNDTSSDTSAPSIDGATLRSANLNVGLYTYVIDANVSMSAMEFCNELQDDSEVLLCVPDMMVSIDQAITPVPAVTNDPLSGQQWGLGAVNVPDAWASGITGLGEVRICLMDSGFDLTQPDLQQNIWKNPGEIPNNGIDDDGNGYVDDVNGFSFINGVQSNNVQDQNGHGMFKRNIERPAYE